MAMKEYIVWGAWRQVHNAATGCPFSTFGAWPVVQCELKACKKNRAHPD